MENHLRDMYMRDSLAVHQQLQAMNEILQRKQATIDSLMATQDKQQLSPGQDSKNAKDMEELQNRIRTLSDENNMLRERLRDTISDLSMAASEKARLLDISNGLRATIRRYEESSQPRVSKGTQSRWL
jgi:uncharacterized protein YdcH (DUF465 family)